MKILNDLTLLRKKRNPIVLAAGFFDGLHKGHQKVIEQTIHRAKAFKGEAWVLTFDKHPLKVLRPKEAPLLLTSNRHRLVLLKQYNIDGCLMMPFTLKLAGLNPSEFVNDLLAGIPTLKEILVGVNWRFGRKREGTSGILSRLCGERGVKVTFVRSVISNGLVVSSTRIRSKILNGNFKSAGKMLGRSFSILGTVKRGSSRGREMGFPTANLDLYNEVLPPFGVYAVYARLNRKLLKGVLNLGFRPTFDKKMNKLVVELHIFDFNGDLYGRDIEVFFVDKLRNERKFRSKDELKRQIILDKGQALKLLL